jgi:hypothetical protein
MKWAIREAIDVYFKAKSVFKLGARTVRAGEPVLIFDTVKTSTLEVTAAQSYVTGGRGNTRILAFEGDKALTFQFEDALLSTEGMAILAGADLIPARNKHLPGSSPEARSVIAHYTERYPVTTTNRIDTDTNNVFPDDTSLGPSGDRSPMGGILNIWLSRKPYVGQNSSIYIMLLDKAGEMSGSPLEINLKNSGGDFFATTGELQIAVTASGIQNGQKFMGIVIANVNAVTSQNLTDINATKDNYSYLPKFSRTDNQFIAFDRNGAPMSLANYPNPTTNDQQAVFDDLVTYYVDPASANDYWNTAWGDIGGYERTIGGTGAGGWDITTNGVYGYLIAPSGGVGQPKAFKEGSQIVYKLNVPSILYQDIVLIDYYVEYLHDATQVSVLPDKFAPYMYVEGSSLLRRASDGMDLPVEFVIPKFKITTALNFTLQSTGDPSTFTFQGDAYPDFSKFDLTRKVFVDVQVLDADDNYDGAGGDSVQADPTSYKRFQYNQDEDGSYLWKDPSIEPHGNLDYSDTGDYVPTHGGPATKTPGLGLIDTQPSDGIPSPVYP